MVDGFPTLTRRAVACALAVSFAGAAACGRPVRRPDGGEGLLPVGAQAPEVVGFDLGHHEVRLSALRGRPAVVYFYPKDGSPACTREACAFRDAWAQYTHAGVSVIGVSGDSPESHDEFLRNEKLPFALAADTNGRIAAAYGVGHKLWGDDRITFLIGLDGKIAHVWPNVDPGIHASEVIAAASRL
jgi:thioredoxin-dependent peroxiredoxin